MTKITYRGFEVEPAIVGGTHNGFVWTDDEGVLHGGFLTDEEAMNAIDAYKRAQRQTSEART